jgi:hypothetical protein
MGRQIGFFADSVDFLDVLTFAESAGFLALPELTEANLVPEAISPAKFRLGTGLGSHYFYLLAPGFAPEEALYKKLAEEPSVSKLTSWASPVIEVSPCQLDGDQARPGRVYFDMEAQDDRYTAAFKGYNRLARYLQKWQLADSERLRVGPHTAAEWAAGRLLLRHGKRRYGLSGKT